MSKLRSIRTLGILFALMAYLFSITTLSPAGAETASIPVTVTASSTVGLVDGQAITVNVGRQVRLITPPTSRQPFPANVQQRHSVRPVPMSSNR